ncbi:MAG: sulfurtransferase-like selenium metabolism protein YedF [Desulfovibrio sp.]|nr:MAG: sulfurtransferase-like selenium metabolism protein YedF [Desulfovibrio sp.]
MPIPALDCCGLACPLPVLRCKELIEDSRPESFTVMVDNDAAKQNVSRFLSGQGYSVEAQADNGKWLLAASLQGDSPAPTETSTDMSQYTCAPAVQQTTVFLTSERMGQGDDDLGAKLMANFLATLPEMGEELWRLVLVNGGVKLAATGSPVLESLTALEKSGVTILVCGTCLDHFGLLDARAVGQTTNMLDVVTSLQAASKVIHI